MKASYNEVLCADADSLYGPRWVAIGKQVLQNAAAVYGPRIPHRRQFSRQDGSNIIFPPLFHIFMNLIWASGRTRSGSMASMLFLTLPGWT